MPAQKPEEVDQLLLKALEKGDLDTAIALYEPTAKFVISPEQVVTGHAAIRKVLQGFIDAKATFDVEAITAVLSTDGTVAVTRLKCSSTSQGPDGEPVTSPLHTVEVVRKQTDGSWLFIVDDPSGEGVK
jgi:uncharacterized protein (TIGR02246 family)